MSKILNKKTTLYRFKGIEWIFMNLPFVCYLALLGIVYIYNVHTTEKNLRRIEALEKVVKDTESKYMNLKQEVMYGSTQSQMQDKVASMDLKYTGQLPKKIKVDKKKESTKR